MPHRPARSPLMLALALALGWSAATTAAGCGSWTVIKQSGPPSALTGITALQVGFDASEAMFGDQTLAEHRAAAGEASDDLLPAMNRQLVRGFGEVAPEVPVSEGDAQPQLVVKYLQLVAGRGGPFGKPSILKARLLWSVSGAVTDEIEAEVMVTPSEYRPSAGKRLVMAAFDLGKVAAEYFLEAQ